MLQVRRRAPRTWQLSFHTYHVRSDTLLHVPDLCGEGDQRFAVAVLVVVVLLFDVSQRDTVFHASAWRDVMMTLNIDEGNSELLIV